MATQIAQLRYLKVAPRKVRALAGIIRGLSVNEAEAQLIVGRRRAAGALLKLLRSAVANAKNNQKLSIETLYIKAITVDGGPMLKRYLPRARGMATPIQKKLSHITLTLGEKKDQKTNRFTIVVKKKAKKPLKDAKPGRKDKEAKKEVSEDKETKPRRQNPGFFQKVFSRKSGMGK